MAFFVLSGGVQVGSGCPLPIAQEQRGCACSGPTPWDLALVSVHSLARSGEMKEGTRRAARAIKGKKMQKV